MLKLLSLTTILLSFSGAALAETSSVNYRYRNSLLNWKKIEHEKWLSYKRWEKRQAIKDTNPNWRENLRDATQKELMGRVLHCIGLCQIVQSGAAVKAVSRSKVYEGDDLVTVNDSYAWILLVDGTLVRIAPETSVSLKEIIVSRNEVFYQARLNYGNVYWLSRDGLENDVIDKRETDVVFLPMPLLEANETRSELEIGNELLYDVYANRDRYKNHYERLNRLIIENNQFAKNKETYTFLVLPNGSVFGKNLRVDAISLFGKKSYIKNRTAHYAKKEVGPEPEQVKVKETEEMAKKESVATFLFRGLENEKEETLENGVWYEVGDRGRTVFQLDSSDKRFSIGEFVTKRTPTIFVARELWLKKYSAFLFDPELSAEKLSSEYGYQIWDGMSQTPDNPADLDRRISFLKEYTRRLETKHLGLLKQFIEVMNKRGEKLRVSEYGPYFYRKAMDRYNTFQERNIEQFHDGEVLNSTKKLLWKLMHAK